MTLARALALLCLAMLASAEPSHAATGPRCTEGTWTIDGGPVAVGPLEISLIQLNGDGPAISRWCRAQRWELRRAGELRVLFVCGHPDDTAKPRRFPLRLRARLTAACAHLDGALAVRRRAAWVRFTATKTGASCTSDDDCAVEAFCNRPIGECTVTDGRCAARPLECSFGLQKLVCGCDGRTWPWCDAVAAGVSIADDDPCPDSCGGIAGIPCPDGQFCELPEGQCGSADLEGQCVPMNGACPEFYSPVCGCDGVTYANDCFRQAAGAQKAHDGACDGCASLLDCLPNEYCQSTDGQCGVLPGVCTFVEQVCDTQYDPVCGCDGETYGNRCQASMHAVSVAHAGACPNACETSCDCYAELGSMFCDDCPLLCPSCGDFWQCKEGRCVEQCGVFPPDVRTCMLTTGD